MTDHIHPSRVTPTTRFNVTGVQPTSITPGPWTVNTTPEGFPYVETVEAGRDIASICYYGTVVGEDEANARAIAAVPELIEALKVVEWGGPSRTCPSCGNDRDGGVHTDTCRLVAALRKAGAL